MPNKTLHIQYLRIVLTLCILLLGSFTSSTLLANPNPRILLLGDSITMGRDNPDRIPYRVPLWNMLQSAGINADFIGSISSFRGTYDPANYPGVDLDHEGHWGWEVGELADDLSSWMASYDADYVLIHAGTNDIDRGQSTASTINEMTDIINILRSDNPQIVILLGQIIPMEQLTGNKDVTPYNNALAALAAAQTTPESPVILVDHNTGYDPNALNYDFYHPNAQGATQIAQNWFDQLMPLLTAENESDAIEVPLPFATAWIILLVITGWMARKTKYQ